jgi:hypothetical protein
MRAGAVLSAAESASVRMATSSCVVLSSYRVSSQGASIGSVQLYSGVSSEYCERMRLCEYHAGRHCRLTRSVAGSINLLRAQRLLSLIRCPSGDIECCLR